MGELVLRVLELEEGLSSHRFLLSHQWLARQLEGVDGIEAGEGEGAVELDATRSGAQVLIRGEVGAGLEVECVRCLERYRLPVEAELEVLMLPQGSIVTSGQGDGEEDEDLGVERYRGDEIVLDELIRDTILLEVPMNPNCGDDCQGWDALSERRASRGSTARQDDVSDERE